MSERSNPGRHEGPVFTEGLVVWIDGRLYADPAEAHVPAVDHGLVVGDGVFEVMKATAEGAFAVTRHLARLGRSAERMGLPEFDEAALRDGIDAVLAARRGWDVGRLRITYTAGIGPLGSHRLNSAPMLMVAAEPCAMPAETDQIVTVPWTRNLQGAMTGVKTTSYGENVRALAYAKQRGCGEAIFANSAGNLSEGTGSNIFCVFGDEVVTPPLSAGPLDGITRALVLEWFGAVERDLTLEEAKSADEVFLTSTTRDVQATVAWDETTWDAPGPVAAKLRREFQERAAADLDPR